MWKVQVALSGTTLEYAGNESTAMENYGMENESKYLKMHGKC